MKLVPSSKRSCHLARGEVRRVPQNPMSFLIAYHVCCPRCGFVTPAFEGHDGLRISEGVPRDDLSFSHPLRCTYCRVLMHASHGEFRLEEDADVRSI